MPERSSFAQEQGVLVMSKHSLLAAASALALSMALFSQAEAAPATQQCWSKLLASGQKMTGAEWLAYACQAVNHLTDARALAQIASTKSDICAAVATDRLVQLLAHPETASVAENGMAGAEG